MKLYLHVFSECCNIYCALSLYPFFIPSDFAMKAQVGASGPVRLLFSENVAVVEFWDSIAKR
jgi:hypothetical protein